MKNIPILTFVTRYWQLILAAIALVLLCLNDTVFQHLGALVYIPAVTAVAILSFLLVTHLLFRQTIDAYLHSGNFVTEFAALEPKLRVIVVVIVFASFFIGECIVAASVGK